MNALTNGDSRGNEIVITGCGVVSPIGIGPTAYWDALTRGQSGLGPITQFDAGAYPANIVGEVKNFDPKQYVRPRKSLKVMCRDIQLSFAAADMAMTEAGLDTFDKDPDRLGVVFGADMMYSPIEEIAEACHSCESEGQFRFERWGTNALENLYPLWMLKYLPNMSACHIAIAHDARGPNNTVILSDVSALLALMEAVRVIERGQADIMITGGGARRNHAGSFVFRGHRHLSHRTDDPASACRPFDATRDGTVNGEGAAAFVLERRRHAEARGAKILARVRGYASRTEPLVEEGQRPSGVAIRGSISAALAASGMQREEIGHVNANGLATREDDPIEAQAIHAELGDVPVTAPKSFFGNLGAGSGSVEMIASLLALQKGLIPPTLNYAEPDPECPINVVHGEMLATDRRGAMILNQSTTGQAAAVVIEGE